MARSMSEPATPEPEERKLRPMTSLLASAQRITSETLSRVALHDPKEGGWQADAWDLFDLVGEYEFIVSSLAGRVGSARLYAGKINPDDPTDEPERIETAPKVSDPNQPTEPRSPTDDLAMAALKAFGKTLTARAQLLERQSENLSVTGEGYLVGVPRSLLDGDEFSLVEIKEMDGISPEGQNDSVPLSQIEWRVLSVSEVSPEGKENVRLKIDGDDYICSPTRIWLIRIWNPHPRRWMEANCATKASLPVLRELVGLTQTVSASLDSRLASAGVFLVPQSAEDAVLASLTPDELNDLPQGYNPFTEAMLVAFQAAMEDQSNASARVPITFTVPDTSIEFFKYMTFATPLDKETRALREEAIRRLALGMNIPPEVLLGTGGMNHWGAWMVREDTIATYVEPQLALICDALTTQYLWPVLRSQEVPEEDLSQYVIWYDVDHLITRPNRLQDAIALHQEEVISDAALRDAGGFGDEDAKLDTETTDEAAAIVLSMVKANASLLRNPGVDILLQNIRALLKGTAAGAPAGPAIDSGAPTEDQPIDGERVQDGPPSDSVIASSIQKWFPPQPPTTININVEPADVRAAIHLSEGLTAAAAPNVTVVNNVEPTPLEIYNEVMPTPVTVENAINVETPSVAVNVEAPAVTVEAPNVSVEAPAVTVNPPAVSVEAPSVTVEAPAVTVTPAITVTASGEPKPNSKILTGKDGTVAIPDGYAIAGFSAECGQRSGSIKVGSANAIPVPRKTAFSDDFDDAPIKAKSVVFKSTTAYYVRVVPV